MVKRKTRWLTPMKRPFPGRCATDNLACPRAYVVRPNATANTPVKRPSRMVGTKVGANFANSNTCWTYSQWSELQEARLMSTPHK